MVIASVLLEKHTIFSWIDVVYVAIGATVTFAIAKVYGGFAAKENSTLAASTVQLLQTQVGALEKQMELQKDSYDKHSVQQDKIIDDLRERNTKLEDQVKTLSIIPWQKAEERHVELMKAISEISTGQLALANALKPQRRSRNAR